MQSRYIWIVLFILAMTASCETRQTLHDAETIVIPVPQDVRLGARQFLLEDGVTVWANHAAESLLPYFVSQIEADFGLRLVKGNEDAAIQIRIDQNRGSAGYRLSIGESQITVTGFNAESAFNGLQTLRQIAFSRGDDGGIVLPELEIQDQPSFGWRGLMLDEGRYFHGKRAVMDLLDHMALLKMNHFHWHLADDQGWRIEIKKYPRLTAVGAYRKDTQVGGWDSPDFAGEPHGGFYTQDDIRDIIDYAARRFITIVPEIDMPGHASAAIAAYPWLGVAKQEISVPTVFGVHENVLNVADPEVMSFVHDVLGEVMDLFPGKFIHVGGDEVRYTQWENSQQVRDYMQEMDIASFADLQLSFTNDLSTYIGSKGRRMIGWNEILGTRLHDYQEDRNVAVGTLDDAAVVHFWKGDIDLARDAASRGYEIVNADNANTYLDYSYVDLPIEKILEFSPIPAGLEKDYRKNIIGMSCQVWTEWIPDKRTLHRQVFPRIAACAEVAWNHSTGVNQVSFNEALPALQQLWKSMGVIQIGPDLD